MHHASDDLPGGAESATPYEGRAAPLRIGRIVVVQAAGTAALVGGSLATGRGSPGSILAGAALLLASLLLTHFALGVALRRRRPGVAVGLFLAKLGLLLAVAAVGLGTSAIAPMSLAAGASTLLLAIVADACYGNPAPGSGRTR
jgi:hypothetical protein